jgi:prepilin-type N-terminal cleavage/methylation domain-containing protein
VSGNRRHFCNGFTLIEILVSLAVVATAATILVSLFGSSLVLTRSNRSRLVAASLAEEQMDSILRNSSKYVWNLDGAESGQLVEVVPAEPAQSEAAGAAKPGIPAGWRFDRLVAAPVEPAANAREEIFYGKFRWQAYVALPQPNSKHVDVTVVVRWKDAGRDKSVALTSSAPRFSLGSRPPAASRPLAAVQPIAVDAGGRA